MADWGRVINGLELCRGSYYCQGDTTCPYCGKAHCAELLMDDALELLKAQEPITNTSISSAIECLLHPQDADDSDMAKAIDTAIRAMRSLKAQEPVTPCRDPFLNWHCGYCKTEIDRYEGHKYCPNCGKKVRWE